MRSFQVGIFGILLAVLGIVAPAHAEDRPLALVYEGEGACLPCIHGAIKVAHLAGFDVRLVDRTHWDDSLLYQAKLWIQPGGQSVHAGRAMGSEFMAKVRQFVAQGGGYVGFCAGSFISTSLIGDKPHPGLGIVPGSTANHIQEDSKAYRMEKVLTRDGDRWVFFAGGPQFLISQAELDAVQGRVTSWARDGQVLSLEAHFGDGKVAVSGFHPEASTSWKEASLFVNGGQITWDKDGSDYDFAINMIRYVTSR